MSDSVGAVKDAQVLTVLVFRDPIRDPAQFPWHRDSKVRHYY